MVISLNKDVFQNSICNVRLCIRFIRSFDDGNRRISTIGFYDNFPILFGYLLAELFNDIIYSRSTSESALRIENRYEFENYPQRQITPERVNSNNTITTQIMLITIPIGPLLIFEEGLNPRIGSVLSARSSSISPIDFMIIS